MLLANIANKCLRPLVTLWTLFIFSSPQVLAQSADELLHREALYHFYNNDYLQTLVLLENEHVGSNHIDNEYHNLNHILALEANMRFGLLSNVEHILEHLKFTAREKEVKQTALLYQGRMAYDQGNWRQAISFFSDALKAKGLSKNERDEAYYYLANSLLQVSQVNEAAKILGAITDNSIWAAYGYYNLGIYYAKKDPDNSRALISLRVASAMTGATEEGQELNDRVLLAAGHIAMEDDDFNKALSFLKNVRASGTSAPAAIYDYGRAYAGLGRYRTAIQSWHRGKKFALVVPGVADTFQAIAFGYEKENLRATAIDAYLEAIAVYEKELRQLDSIIAALREEGALHTLVEIKRQNSSVEWFLATDLITNTPTVAFVNYLMEDPEFYELAKEELQLNELLESILTGQNQLSVYKKTLAQRAKEVGGAAKKGQGKLDAKMLNAVVDERNALAKSLAEAEANRDYQEFTPAQFASAGERIVVLNKELLKLDDQLTVAEKKALHDRVDRLQGAILWDSMDGYKQNRAALVADMQAIDVQLVQLKDNFVRIKEDLGRGNGLFDNKLKKVQHLAGQYSLLMRDLTSDIKLLDKELTAKAVVLLNQHRQQIDSYYVRSQLSLVNLYDDLALADLEKSKAKAQNEETPL